MALCNETKNFIREIALTSMGLWALLIVGQGFAIYRCQDPQKMYACLSVAGTLASSIVAFVVAWLHVDVPTGLMGFFGLRRVSLLFVVGSLLTGAVLQLLTSDFGLAPELSINALCGDGTPYLLLVVTVVLVTPIAEEAIFRGYFISAGQRARMPDLFVVLLAAIPWTWLHERESWLDLAPVFLTGLLYGSVRILCGSIAPSIAAHVGWNAMHLVGFFLECSARR